MKRLIAASVVALTILSAQAKADTIVFYSFNTNATMGLTSAQTNFVETANIGPTISQFSNFNPAGTPLTILSSVSSNPNNHGYPAGNSVSQNAWNSNNAYFQFTLDSTGYQSLILAWAGNVSGTGPTSMTLQYSTTGVSGTFTPFATFATPANSMVTEDLTSITALNNNASDVFRLVGSSASAAGGTAKIDNFSIDATVVPEPSTIFLIGCGLVGILPMIRRRRS